MRHLIWPGFDVLHVHNPPDTLAFVTFFHRALGKRCVFDHHDIAPEMYDAREQGSSSRLVVWILRRLEKLSCRAANHVIATNESYRSLDIERNGVRPECISVVRNGPDISELEPVAPVPEWRGRAAFIVGYLGVIGPQDGVDQLVRAIFHLVTEEGIDDVLCVIIGHGESVGALKRLVSKLGLDDYVVFTGRLSSEEFVPILSSVDVCVVPDPPTPYNSRSTMLKLMDYLALARAVVAYDLVEHRVTAGDAAVYVDAGEPQALSRGIAALMRDPARRAELGAAGRERALTHLSWERSIPPLLQTYERLLGTQPSAHREQDMGVVT
jgi:glycosyltransferase involved in cell wall biosynthesis